MKAERYRVLGLVDDNPTKKGIFIHGVPVRGTVADIKQICEEEEDIDEILIAVPSATQKELRQIVSVCRGTKLKFQTLPSMDALIDGRFTVSQFRNVEIDDLLGREAVKLEMNGCLLTISDEIIQISDRIYVKATATFRHKNEIIQASSFARENDTKKGMDPAQITGAASSYARKYALNGLFLIDDTKDADGLPPGNKDSKPSAVKEISSQQLGRIKSLQTTLQISEDAFLARLQKKFHVKTIGELTDAQAQQLIAALEVAVK